jgi:hypothetical protein
VLADPVGDDLAVRPAERGLGGAAADVDAEEEVAEQ